MCVSALPCCAQALVYVEGTVNNTYTTNIAVTSSLASGSNLYEGQVRAIHKGKLISIPSLQRGLLIPRKAPPAGTRIQGASDGPLILYHTLGLVETF